LKCRGQGLLVGAVCHPDRYKNGIVQQLRERFLGDIEKSLLHHGIAATRVFPIFTGDVFQPDRIGVRRLLSIQHLNEGRYGNIRRVSRKTVDGKSGSVRQ